MNRSTLIVLHAHPDDESIFTGATIRRAADAGIRVVVVTATSGEAGPVRVRLAAGESLRSRRIDELERACDVLGAARLVLLDHRDSGAHAGPYAAGTLGAASAARVARQVERVVRQENACAVVHYDRRGIYGHVDHVQVHRAGRRAARWTGVSEYRATVDRQRLGAGPLHLVRAAAGDDRTIGVPPHRVGCTLRATVPELLAKMAAMAAHASQIGPRWLDPTTFARGYGTEWFVRPGEPGLLDALCGPGPGTGSAPTAGRRAGRGPGEGAAGVTARPCGVR